jgi:ACS family hexuronate transporter-like MFS transporter
MASHVSDIPSTKVESLARGKWGWVAIAFVMGAASLNYLDRQLLSAVAPTLRSEFGLSNTQYGTLISAFSITYMFMAPVAGLIVDRVGLKISLIVAVSVWSLASGATAFVDSFAGFLICRLILGMAEAAGIPCSSKATGTYLRPSEFGLGNALQAVGISVGAISAPLLVVSMTPTYGWRSAFIISASLGLVWVLLWFIISRRVVANTSRATTLSLSVSEVVGDRRLWVLVTANALVMTLYSLWSNWTTVYFVKQHHLTQLEANQYFAWIPPIFATVGAFCGGWLALRRIRNGDTALAARVRVCRVAAPILLITGVIPFITWTPLAASAISLSFFACMIIAINIGVMPIDIFGRERAAFTAAVMTSSYALMQSIISPVIGRLLDRHGFGVVCIAMSVLPFIGVLLLQSSAGTLAECRKPSKLY